MIRYMDRVLESMSRQCLSTVERTTDTIEMFFNSFSHSGDETSIKRHKNGILAAQLAQAKTFRGTVKLTSEKEEEILKMSGAMGARNKKSLNESTYLVDVPGESPWSGLSKLIDQQLVDWTANGTILWNDEPWPQGDQRWSFEWWLAQKLRGLWPTFPLVPNMRYLPKQKGGAVNYSAWTSIRDNVTNALSEMSRKERRRAARLAKGRTHSVNKRQVIFLLVAALVSVGSVLFNEFEINSMVDDANKNVDATIEVLDRENHRLSVAEHSISMISSSLEIVQNQLRSFGYELQADEAVFEAHVSIRGFYDEVDRFLNGLETLGQGYLSPSFVKVKPTEAKLSEMRNKLKRRGYSMGINSFNEIYSLPCSHAVYSDGSAYAILHIPIIKESNSFTLYAYDPVPYVDVGSESLSFMITAEHDLIAVSRDESRHVLMKFSELDKCSALGDSRICPNSNVVSKQNKDSCLGALFKNDLDTARSLCMFKTVNSAEFVTQTSTNEFLLYAKKQTAVKFVCADGKDEVSKRLTISGAYLLTVQGGCVAYTVDHELEGQLDFSAKIKGYEVRPLNLSKLFAQNGELFNEKDLLLLDELNMEIGMDVPVSTVASKFHHLKTTGLWQSVMGFFDSIGSYMGLIAGIIVGIIVIYLSAPLLGKIFTCCKSLAERRRKRGDNSGPRKPPSVHFAVGSGRATWNRSSVWGRSKRNGATPTNLQIARDLVANGSTQDALEFLTTLTARDSNFSPDRISELIGIIVAGGQMECEEIDDVVLTAGRKDAIPEEAT